MKKLIFTTGFSLFLLGIGFSQVDTISNNIYQNNGNLGIGIIEPTSRFELICDEIITYPSFGILSIKNNHYATFDGFAASNIDYVCSLINGRRSRGTLTFPENVQPGDRLTGITSAMYYNDAFRFNSSILFYAGEGLGEDSYPSYIVFRTTDKNEDSGSERMRLTEKGYLGIGTSEPQAKLQISDGDIYIGDINKGIIMKSPDGNCWRGILDNTGNLNFSQIDCPELFVQTTQEIKSSNRVSIFPNPTENIVTINIEESEIKKIWYSIHDINSKIMVQGNFKKNNNILDISSLKPGLYIIKLSDKKGNIITSNKIFKE